MDNLLNAQEVSEILRISPKTVYRLALEKKIPSIQLTVRGSVRFDRNEIIRWLRSKKRYEDSPE